MLPLEDYRHLLDVTPDAMLLVDADGIIVLANEPAGRLFGCPTGDVVGRSVDALVPQPLQPSHAALRARFAAQPTRRPMGSGLELWARRMDGTEVAVEIALSPISTLQGQVVCVSLRDVSQRRAAHRTFELLLESAPDAMVIVDHDGLIKLVNRRTEEMFGHPRASLIGQPIEVLMPLHTREAHRAHRNGYITHASPRPMGQGLELSAERADGSVFPVEISLGPLQTEEGLLVSAAIRDVSERHAYEQELALQARDLARSNADLEQFAYMASHDLQEPLRKVAGFCQLLEEDYGDQLDDDARTYIGYAVDGAQRMRALISDLLEFSSIGRRDVRSELVDVATVVEQARFALDAAQQEAAATIDVGPLPTVVGEPSHLLQLFQNLLGNALKFRSDDRPCTIRINAERDDLGWLFSIADNGIGLEPRHAERIFQVFQRLHTRQEYQGTGIGLAICRRIVERMGGSLWAESEPGSGTTFWWTIPDRTASAQ